MTVDAWGPLQSAGPKLRRSQQEEGFRRYLQVPAPSCTPRHG